MKLFPPPIKANEFLRQDTGVAAVEFALIAPILMILIIAMVDFGMFINSQMRVENLSRSVAEYIIQGGDEENAWGDVVLASGYFSGDDNLEDTLSLEAEKVCECNDADEIDCDESCGTGEYKRHFIEVSMEMNYTPMIPYPGITTDLVATGHTRLQIE